MLSQHPLGQHFLAGFDGFAVTPVVRDLILKDKILGFTLFKWNIESAEQLQALNAELQALARQAGYELILAVDQEGGRVARLPIPFTKIPPMQVLAKISENAGAKIFYELGKVLGSEVRLAGFNLDFAPVVDINSNPKNPIIGDRAFGSDAATVTRAAREVIRGLITEGVIPCLKHFPGHGDTIADSHLELPQDGRALADLLNVDIAPYRDLIAAGLAPTLMTAHVLYPEIDAKHPATLSETVITEILRGDLQYDGIIFSDDFLMKAIDDHWELSEAAERFFAIGGDVVLICKEPERTRAIIAELTAIKNTKRDENLKTSLQRIQNLKNRFLPKLQNDSESLAEISQRHQEWLQKLLS